MNSKFYILILAIPILIFSTGCTPDCTPEELQNFDIFLESPPNGAVLEYDQSPVFEWTYQESCQPSAFIVIVTREDGDTQQTGLEDGTITSIDKGISLDPGFSYEWHAQALVFEESDKEGESGYHYSPQSETRSFTADGICSTAELIPPDLSTPTDGEIVDNFPPGMGHHIIDWFYSGDCYPASFHYQAAADPNFLNMITSGEVIFKDYYTSWDFSPDYYKADIPVPGCAQIYWRVQAGSRNGTGPFSEIRSFTYSTSPNCFLNQQPGPATLIKGYVYADYCKNTKPWIPEGIDIWPPCIFGEPYGVHADGIRNLIEGENETTGEPIPIESGIPEVVVDLGAGPCPSTGLDQIATFSNGSYYFMVPSPGEYCLSINKANNPDLDHGIWTLPITNNPITQTTITVDEGMSLALQDFGWDQNDYLQIEYLVELQTFCRIGDSKEHQEVAVLKKGAVTPIFARNEQGTWFATLVDGKRCYLSVATGTPQEDTGDLPIYPQLPPPAQEALKPSDKPASCNSYTSSESCLAHGCTWTNFASGGICSSP